MNLEELRARLGNPVASIPTAPSGPSGPPIEECVDGRVVETSLGSTFCMDTFKAPKDTHGQHRFDDLDVVDAERLVRFVQVAPTQSLLQGLDISRIAFVDTETTGLGYGVGTYVFMLGIGHRVANGFKVKQFFLRHPGEEAAMLTALGEYLCQFDAVVSYNGRSFDWPLLENRFILKRIPHPPPVEASRPHLDLLHLSRRLWKLRLESCSMDTIESKVLGVTRTTDDLEGWVIPHLYFRYLRSGNAKPMRRVFYHNLCDVLSLAALTVHLDRLVGDGAPDRLIDPVDVFSLGRVHQGLEDMDRAVECFREALGLGVPRVLEAEALLRLGLIEKRRRNWPEAVSLFEQVLERRHFESIACVELAKYYEHIARDHHRAMALTARAMASLDFGRHRSWPGTDKLELVHRRRRLTRRIGEIDQWRVGRLDLAG